MLFSYLSLTYRFWRIGKIRFRLKHKGPYSMTARSKLSRKHDSQEWCGLQISMQGLEYHWKSMGFRLVRRPPSPQNVIRIEQNIISAI